MSAQSFGRRSSAADARAVIGEVGQLCCQTPIMSGAVRPGEPEKEMANCERAAGKRESHFFAPGAKAPAPEQGERANTDWRSVSVVRSVFARSSECRQTLSGGRAKDGKEPTGRPSPRRAASPEKQGVGHSKGARAPWPNTVADVTPPCHRPTNVGGKGCGKAQPGESHELQSLPFRPKTAG